MASDPQPDTHGSPTSLTSPTSPSGRKGSMAQVLYRRPLPDSCIAFASDEGKTIFREALATGHMNCYFRLASQFRTQDEPAYCGLSTLIMVLNALEIDPGRVWKGPWKWYHEDMLDCCISTELVRKEGITFDEFICLADCNNLEVDAARVDGTCKEEMFRALVKTMTLKENSFLVLSYSRQALNQTGDGHFAPVSGYHPKRDLVLILDTARFKYPPHWIPLPRLFEAMQRLDKSTGLPRGYIQLWATKDAKRLLLFKTSEQFSVNANPHDLQNIQRFVASWNQQLAEPWSATDTSPPSAVVRRALQGLVRVARALEERANILTTQDHISCTHGCNLQCIVKQLLAELRDIDMFRAICEEVLNMPNDDIRLLENLFGIWPSVGECQQTVQIADLKEETGKKPCCDMNQYLCLCDFVTAFFLSWPYSLSPPPSTLESALGQWARDSLQGSRSQLLVDEVTILHRQLKKLTGFHMAGRASTKCKNTCHKGAAGKEPGCQRSESLGRSACCAGQHK